MNPRPPKGYRFPPGPQGNPIIGHLGKDVYDLYLLRQWRKEYGDIISFDILGNRYVFIFSRSIASDLFEKRSSNYSDRHPQPMIRLQGWGFNLGFMRYGERWRRHRRGFHQFFNPNAVKNYQPVQLQGVRDLVVSLHEDSQRFVNHLEYFTASIIMKIVYNYEMKHKGDNFVDIVRVALEGVAKSINIGSYLVDFLPFLDYVPEWLPGAGWKRKARYYRTATLAVNTVPFQMVKEDMEKGAAGHSTTATALARLHSKLDSLPDDEEVIMNVSGVAYAAGAGTSLSGLLTLIFAMVQYPEAQKKAQEEIDRIVKNHLPTLDDRARLPYTNAFCEETQRWRPVFPLGMVHTTLEDDIYGDYFIPKGTLLMGNSWEILRDEATCGPNVEDFDPERFFRAGVRYPSAQWGYGRRVCPGRHLAGNTLFLAAATILKLFDVLPAKDEHGNNIPISEEYTTGGIIAPKPFQCEFKPRSDFARTFLKENTAPTDN
ncbi:hypothetical protein M422DRAFT_241328 [Sphaerobolus stellatus SS14]|nr:hypothetical protein M422DRAFT_241328 [Sphaerobolus stellatus SS14]